METPLLAGTYIKNYVQSSYCLRKDLASSSAAILPHQEVWVRHQEPSPGIPYFLDTVSRRTFSMPQLTLTPEISPLPFSPSPPPKHLYVLTSKKQGFTACLIWGHVICEKIQPSG